jgi:hypothetical protein
VTSRTSCSGIVSLAHQPRHAQGGNVLRHTWMAWRKRQGSGTACRVLRTSPKSRHWGMAWSPKSAARRPTLPRPQAHVSVRKVKVTGAVLVGRVREKPEQGTGIGPPVRPPRVPGNFCEHESCSRCRLALGEPAQMEDAGGGIGRARRGRIRWKAEEPSILWKPQSNPK